MEFFFDYCSESFFCRCIEILRRVLVDAMLSKESHSFKEVNFDNRVSTDKRFEGELLLDCFKLFAKALLDALEYVVEQLSHKI